MVGCVLSQLKPSELYFFSCGKNLAKAFSTAKNVQLLGLYSMHKAVALGVYIKPQIIKSQITLLPADASDL